MSDSLHPMDCRLPSSSAHGIFQARVLEWVAPIPPPTPVPLSDNSHSSDRHDQMTIACPLEQTAAHASSVWPQVWTRPASRSGLSPLSAGEKEHTEIRKPGSHPNPHLRHHLGPVLSCFQVSISLSVPGFCWLAGEARLATFLIPYFAIQL